MRAMILLVLAVGTVFLSACVTTDYVGQSYSPTKSVVVFYNMDDVERPHTVMGRITATAVDGWDSESMIEELKTQALAKGADALVIEGVHTDTVGSYTSTYGNDNGPKWVVTEDGKLKDVSKGSTRSTSITTETKEKVMDAKLVKYR